LKTQKAGLNTQRPRFVTEEARLQIEEGFFSTN
jgi:hypothetical protein